LACPESPNCVSSQAQDKEHFIEPIILKATVVEAKKHLLGTLKSFSNAKIVLQKPNYIKAEFTSTLFRFVDDVEFYFPETKSEEVTIHMRSASRVGHSDMGVNQERLEGIRTKMIQGMD
jgi:uncharacterized protein (DUF1499 family)